MSKNIFRVVRNCLGLTGGEMAERCGISRVYLSELEKGVKHHPSEEIFEKFSNVSNLSIDTLKFFLRIDQLDEFDYSAVLLKSLEDAKKNFYETIK